MMSSEAVLHGIGGTVLVIAAVWGACALGKRSPALRNALWRVGLVALWLVPAAVLLRGAIPVEPITVQIPLKAATDELAVAAGGPPGAALSDESATLAVSARDAEPRGLWARARGLLPWVWAAGFVIGLLLLARDMALGRRALRSSELADDPALIAVADEIAGQMGLPRAPQVHRCRDVSLPAVFGAVRPVLLVPPGLDASDAGSRAVLAHELAHIRRHDLAVQVAARATLALLWWHPGAWLVSRELPASAEEACDDWAVALTGERRPYADVLLRWAENVCAAGGLACQFRGRELIRRVHRTLAERGVPTVHLSRRLKVAVAVCSVLAITVVSGVRLQTARAEEGEGAAPDGGTALSADAQPGTIHEAARKGDVAAVEQHLRDGTDVNAKDNNGWTPLQRAAAAGHKDVVELLLAHGADVNAKDKQHWQWGHTPLHRAASGRHRAVVELLLANGADINAVTAGGQTPLHQVALEGDEDMVELLIERGADVNAADRYGETVLGWAVGEGHKGVVALLLDGGADVKKALFGSAYSGDKDMAEFLLVAGADVNAVDENGWTALDVATWYGRKEVAELLIAEGATWTIHIAAGLGEAEKVREFLRGGADVNAPGWNGCTPLHFAARRGHRDLARLLIEEGADVNAEDTWFAWTPLYWARTKDVAELLLAEGADVAARDNDGGTPLHRAAFTGNWDLAELLIEKGADVNAANNGGSTPLHKAATMGRRNVAELLLARGAEVSAKNKDGKTALQLAAQRGHRDTIALLKEHGAEQ